ncbi:MAG: hypothetical protein KDK70_18915 [Myxococcales bacterium]|nr:hypothetical protein [Myxococcales bacterium]
MSDALASLRRYMPEWMAARGATLLDALPPRADRWVQQTARAVEAAPGPPAADAWHEELVEQFGEGRSVEQQQAIVAALRSAVLLVAIQQLPPPAVLGGEEVPVPAETKTTKLDHLGIKRSRMLGLLERNLPASDHAIHRVTAALEG